MYFNVKSYVILIKSKYIRKYHRNHTNESKANRNKNKRILMGEKDQY